MPPDDDSDPVLLTRIVAIANGESQNGEIYIRHFVASGENYTRNKQYRDLRFWSEGNADYWSGTSVKYPDRTMVGRIGIHSKRQWIEYVEKHYQGGKLESTTTFACRPIKPEIRDEDWKEGGKEVIKHLTFGGVDLHAWIGDNSTRCVTLVRADTASAYAIVTKGPNGRPQKPRVGGSGKVQTLNASSAIIPIPESQHCECYRIVVQPM